MLLLPTRYEMATRSQSSSMLSANSSRPKPVAHRSADSTRPLGNGSTISSILTSMLAGSTRNLRRNDSAKTSVHRGTMESWTSIPSSAYGASIAAEGGTILMNYSRASSLMFGGENMSKGQIHSSTGERARNSFAPS